MEKSSCSKYDSSQLYQIAEKWPAYGICMVCPFVFFVLFTLYGLNSKSLRIQKSVIMEGTPCMSKVIAATVRANMYIDLPDGEEQVFDLHARVEGFKQHFTG